MSKEIHLQIDGRDVEAEEGMTVLEAAHGAGIERLPELGTPLFHVAQRDQRAMPAGIRIGAICGESGVGATAGLQLPAVGAELKTGIGEQVPRLALLPNRLRPEG